MVNFIRETIPIPPRTDMSPSWYMRGRSSLIDPSRPRDEQIAELRQAMEECYCGLGPACEIWRKMTPAQRADCTRDKRAYGQLLWKHGVGR